MNYYEHHIGDYAAATSHLSLIEDAVYTRLLRRYYLQEGPLPAEQGQIARLAGARSAEEVDAVASVLGEFFILEADGWHNKRADEEISRYQDKCRKAKKSSDARWERSGALPTDTEGNPNGMPSECERNANALPTDTEGNALHTPDTKHQIKEKKLTSTAAPSTPPADLTAKQQERLAQVTDDAIRTFNASPLAKPRGLLPTVSAKVGREKRQQQVRRCLRTARAICEEQFGAPTITPEFWDGYWQLCSEDDFHSGRQRGGKGHENWTPDFEFLTREETLLKVYDRSGAGEQAA